MFLQSFPAAVAGNLSLIPEYITPQFSLVRGVMILPHEAAELVTIGGFHHHRAWAWKHHCLWYLRVTGQPAPKE
jgi:hypothetical protein